MNIRKFLHSVFHSRSRVFGYNLQEILIVVVGLAIASYLYQLTTALRDASDIAQSYDKDTRQMLFSASLAYIRFSELLGGNADLDLEQDVLENIDKAQDLCATIYAGGPDGRYRPTEEPQGRPGPEPPSMCDDLKNWRSLTKTRWQNYLDGQPDVSRKAYELAYASFLEDTQPFDGAAAPHIQETENTLRQTSAWLSISLGVTFAIIAFIMRRKRQEQDRQMMQLITENEQRIQLNNALFAEQNLLNALINNLPDAIFAKDSQNHFSIANIAAAQKMGVAKPEQLLGKNEADFQPAEVAERILADDLGLLKGGQSLINQQETLIDRATGKEQCLLTTKVPIRDSQGQIYGLVGIGRDITSQKEVEQALLVANQKLTEGIYELEQRKSEADLLTEMIDLLQACPSTEEACAVIAEQMKKFFPQDSGVLYLFKSSRNVLEQVAAWGRPLPDLVVLKPDDCWGLRRGRMHVLESGESRPQDSGSKHAMLCHHIITGDQADYLCMPLVAQGEALGMLHLRHFINSSEEPVSPNARPWYHPLKKQRVNMIVDSLSLALANLKLRSTLRQQSIRDPLTGLFNRRYLEETLERELVRASRSAEMVGVLMLDIDHFKLFNDTFGHPAGDALLASLGRFLQANIRAEDIACRYGGEEFILMLPEADLETTCKRAQEICDKVKGLNIHHQGQSLGTISLSIGVAVFPQHGQASDVLIQAADQALYQAKTDGRNRMVVARTLSMNNLIDAIPEFMQDDEWKGNL